MRQVERDELERALKFVIEQNRGLCPGKWPKGPDGLALAKRIAEHFARCRWQVLAPPPPAVHGTPGTDAS
jgi:hypothetical protein